MIKVKPLAEVVAKWTEVTPGRSLYYEKAASVAGSDWEAATLASAAAFKAAISAANIEAMFKGGIKKAGAAKYNRKVSSVGVTRFGQGVMAASEDFEKGVGPMLDEIAKITLSAKGPERQRS